MWKLNRCLIYLDIRIALQMLRQNAKCYFSHHSKMFFPVQNNFSTEKNWFYYFQRVNLNEIWMNYQKIFQLTRAGPTSIHRKSNRKVFPSRNVGELFFLEYQYFFNPPSLNSLQSVSCFILGVEIFHRNAFLF